MFDLVLHLGSASLDGKRRLCRDSDLASLSMPVIRRHPDGTEKWNRACLLLVAALREESEVHDARIFSALGASFAVLLDLLIPFLTHNRGWKCRVPQRQCSLLVDLARIARGISDKLGELLSELRIVIFSGTEVLVGRRGLEEDGLGGRRTFINLSRHLVDHPIVER